MGSSHKGSAFEREVCVLLSEWWTNGERDDIFYRTSGSGARAKTRSKTGKRTFGQYGDVQATDPIGQPLLDLCTIELKRGYSRYSIMDILDQPNGAAVQMWEKFIKQAEVDSKNARTPYWMLITKRDRRETLVTIPKNFSMKLPIRTRRYLDNNSFLCLGQFVVIDLIFFLQCISSKCVLRIT